MKRLPPPPPSRRGPGALGWGTAAAVAALVIVLSAVAILRFDATGDALGVYVPIGYTEEVQRWIDAGKLSYDCASERIEARGLTATEQVFYANSSLPGDIDAWNRGDRRPFVVEREELPRGRCEGRLTAVSESYHNQRLPTYEAKSWRGSLFLRPSPGATVLSSGERTLEVLPMSWDLLPLPVSIFEDATFGPKARGARSPKLLLKRPGRARGFARLTAVGASGVLETVETSPEILLDSCPVPQGWRVRLDEGDLVHIVGGRGRERIDERYAVSTGKRGGLVSFLSEINGEPRRKTYTDRLGMADEVARAVDAVVVSAEQRESAGAPDGNPGNYRDDFDVYLTLEPVLHDRMERELEDLARERYGRRPLRAAVTVLEAETGRLLALGSYPTPAVAGELAGDAPVEVLTRNHNFMAHPVGSATKPFLAAAALAAHPELADLRVRCYAPGPAPPESLLGFPMGAYYLPGDCGGADSEGWIDLESFLRVSSNRYMLYLGLLSMAEWEGGRPLADRAAEPLAESEAYRIGGGTLRVRPKIAAVRRGEESSSGGTELQELPQYTEMPRLFRDLFGQEVEYRREGLVDALDLDLWEPVLRAVHQGAVHQGAVHQGAVHQGAVNRGESPPGVAPSSTFSQLSVPEGAAAFAAVTPERVNLRLNLVQRLRQDLYTVLLGGGNNRWSNVQMAEAMARLLTGRRVEARIVERVAVPRTGPEAEDGREGEEESAEELLWDLEESLSEPEPLSPRLRDDHRRRILEGMRQVVEETGGTADEIGLVLKKINLEAPDGVVYRAVAKTGTPTLDPRDVARGPTTAAPGAVKPYGGNPQVESGMLVLALTREEAGETESLAVALYIEGQGGSTEAIAAASELLAPLVETYWPEDWLRAQPQ